MSGEQPVRDVSRKLHDLAQGERTTYADVIRSFGRSAFATCLLAPALVLVSPLSGVPFATSVLGLVIFLVAIQAVFSTPTIWLPPFLARRPLSPLRIGQAATVIAKAGRVLDGVTRVRLSWLVGPVARRLLYALCAVAGGCLPALEIVPFSSSIVGAGVAAIALGILARDGVLALIGVPLICAGLSVPLFAVTMLLG